MMLWEALIECINQLDLADAGNWRKYRSNIAPLTAGICCAPCFAADNARMGIIATLHEAANDFGGDVRMVNGERGNYTENLPISASS
jgi:hypothetical protein